jgi:rhamnose utilization protein RhaD (predicted bifunctional aldolase and dehydrogenase)/NAD(P)-dependent dehydrogenase (short-subunit alcohol dehydrogenase family)
MVNELKTHMTDAGAPTPSVETILHAILPYTFVDHTHADAIVTITNTANGEARIRELYGSRVVVIPYIMPGFDLAKLCAEIFPREVKTDTIGMVLLHHGIFSFGSTAKQSYDRMIELVSRAEQHLQEHNAWEIPPAGPLPSKPHSYRETLATLRRDLSHATGAPMIVMSERDADTLAFAQRPDLPQLTQQGPATPDHVIRTKRIPLLGRHIAEYAAAYRAYFARHAPHAKAPKTILDPAPRVVIDRELGVLSAGRSVADARIVADISRHTRQVLQRAAALGGFRALSEKDLFDMEYWDLEQAKLAKTGTASIFQGEIALVTGAASGIGRACVDSLLTRGAAVVGLDLNPLDKDILRRADFCEIVCDVTDTQALRDALEQTVDRFGGLDMLILNAGIFPGGCRIDSLDDTHWRSVMAINLDANLALLREASSLLKLAPRRGRVVVIGSKNVPAPGPGAAAYSASKAALHQLVRVAALEWGQHGININTVHPNAVFDTALWTADVLAARAQHYGMTIDQYKRNNVLGIDVSSRDVAEMVAQMCGPLFSRTTGAQIPVDGGNERVI